MAGINALRWRACPGRGRLRRMGYVLYGDRRSGSATVEMALAEIGAPVELRPVPLEGDAQLAAEYRRVNPMGRVPTLILPDGTVVTESLAILLTLEGRHPEAAPAARAGRPRPRRGAALDGARSPASSTPASPAPTTPSASAPTRARRRPSATARGRWRATSCASSSARRRPRPSCSASASRWPILYLAVLSRWMGDEDWTPANCPRIEALARAVAARPAAGAAWRRHFAVPPPPASD